MVHLLIVSYRGDAYAGWQRQADDLSVQQVMEEAVSDLVGATVTVIAAGRTDRGVHARGQAAHVRLPEGVLQDGSPKALVHGTNYRLPPDVRVMAAHRMRQGFHARKHALGKEYVYHLVRGSVLSPLDALFAAPAPRHLRLERLREATVLLPGRHDFSAFAKTGGNHTHALRRIDRAEWLEDGARLDFHIEGEGFLRGMVRALVGTLLEVGRGKRPLEDFARLLGGGERADAGPNAPAQGLELRRVLYDPHHFLGDSFPQST
jgi:tRNA pseudouridine38-40 synthase